MTNLVQPRKRNLAWVLAPVLVFGAITALFAYALNTGDPSILPSVLIGKPVPKTSFASLEGLVKNGQSVPGFDSAQLGNGKTSVVNFWASWCGPCITEQAQIVALSQRTGVEIFGVNYKDKPEDARRFVKQYGNPYTALGVDPTGRGAIEWGVSGMPETFVVNPRGEIIYKHTGPITPESLEKKLIPVITAANKAK